MALELKDLRDLLDKAGTYRPGRGIPEPPDENEVARCIQTMLARQCIYPAQPAFTRLHKIMACPDYQGFFQRYFAAMGLELHHDTKSGMLALKVPSADKRRFDWQHARLKKDETLVLFVLKLSYEEGFQARTMNAEGGVEITTDDLVDKLDAVAKTRIEETRLMAILDMLKRKGMVAVGEFDPVERIRLLTVLPGIEIACPEHYVQLIAEWATQQDEAEPEEAEAVAAYEEIENV
jgi:hypothetical protein